MSRHELFKFEIVSADGVVSTTYARNQYEASRGLPKGWSLKPPDPTITDNNHWENEQGSPSA